MVGERVNSCLVLIIAMRSHLKFVSIQTRMLSGLKNKHTRIHIINLGECIQQCKQSMKMYVRVTYSFLKIDTIS